MFNLILSKKFTFNNVYSLSKLKKITSAGVYQGEGQQLMIVSRVAVVMF